VGVVLQRGRVLSSATFRIQFTLNPPQTAAAVAFQGVLIGNIHTSRRPSPGRCCGGRAAPRQQRSGRRADVINQPDAVAHVTDRHGFALNRHRARQVTGGRYGADKTNAGVPRPDCAGASGRRRTSHRRGMRALNASSIPPSPAARQTASA